MATSEVAELFRRITAGVYIIGTAGKGKRDAFTAAWVMQVSFDPPLLALSINPGHASYPLLHGGGGFTVSVLREGQEEVARHFGLASARERDKLAGVRWRPGARGAPILEDALAWFECELAGAMPAGDHELVVGRVVDGGMLAPNAPPLTYAATGDMDGSGTLFPEAADAMSDQRDEGLLRVIGPLGLTASIINVVIGGGIFALPAALALTLGAASPLAFLLGALVMGLVTLSLARAGGRVARSGGVYAYAAEAFGPFPGFLTGVLFVIVAVLSNAGVAAALVDSLALLAPGLARPAERAVALIVLYGALTWVNLRGVATGTRLASATAAVKFGALLLFVVLGWTLVNPDNLVWSVTPSPDALGRGVILGMFAYAGMEIALGASGEVRDPARTIPRALVLAMTLVVLLYVAIQLVAQGVLGPDLATSRAPLAEALGRGAPAGRTFILVLGAISMLGWMAGDLLGSSRQFFAFGREGFLPGPLRAVHPVSRVPHVAIACYATISCALAITGTFAGLAVLASVSVMLLYLSCCAAAWWLSRDSQPLAWLVPSLASLGLLWVLSSATAKEFLAVAGLLAAAMVIYWLTDSRRRASHRPTPNVG